MKQIDIIRKRRSTRTFDGKGLSEEVKANILDCAMHADNPYHQEITWKILSAKEFGLNSPVITGTDTFIAGKMKRMPHAEEAFGYSFEKVVLYAESEGIGTTWIAGTMNRDAFEKAMELAEDEVMPCVSPLGVPAKKMALRETLMRKGVKADSRLNFSELFYEGSFDKPLTIPAAGKLTEVLEAVRLAPSAVNKQPWRVVILDNKAHFYEQQTGGFVSEDGWDLQKIDMGIAMYHFELTAREAGYEVECELNDPGIPSSGRQYIATMILK